MSRIFGLGADTESERSGDRRMKAFTMVDSHWVGRILKVRLEPLKVVRNPRSI
jgi:hypothetical protein